MLQVGDLINQQIPPLLPSVFQTDLLLSLRLLGSVLTRVVLAPAPLEEEGGGSQAGSGSGLLSEC